MENPCSLDDAVYAKYAKDLSISFASLLPQSADDVAEFLTDAARALGEREADLARAMGVSQATFSSWKKRGAIPPGHSAWFATEFPALVLANSKPLKDEGWRHAGLPIVLHLFRQTDFNPFGMVGVGISERIEICWRYVGPLARLALFVAHRAPVTNELAGKGRDGYLAAIVQPLAVAAGQSLRLVSQ